MPDSPNHTAALSVSVLHICSAIPRMAVSAKAIGLDPSKSQQYGVNTNISFPPGDQAGHRFQFAIDR